MKRSSNLKARVSSQPPHVLASWVTERLAALIVSEDLIPGQRIHESKLAEEFGVSRGPIREALRSLEREGLVTLAPRKGASVSRITRKDIEDIYACRSVLEGLAARLATNHLSERSLRDLSTLITQMETSSARGNVKRYFELNVLLHRTVGKLAGNDKLYSLLESLGRQTLRLRYRSLSLPGRLRISLQAHKDIFEAISRGDGRTAEMLTREIIEASGQALLVVLDKGAERVEKGDEIDPITSALRG